MLLLGPVFGATVAYEMTRQFLESGEEVAFLGFLDPTRREGNNRNRGSIHMLHNSSNALSLWEVS